MILQKSKVNDLLEFLSKEADVLVPKVIDGVSKFAPLQSEGEIDFDRVNTTLPPKDMLFPQTEKMYYYSQKKGDLTIHETLKFSNQVIFGIRSCDMRSILCMDEVFLTKGYVDSFYAKKREALLTIAIGCTKVMPTCFCDSMGTDPNRAEGADIQLNDLGDSYLVTAQTEKGKEAVAKWGDFLTEGEGEFTPVSCELKVNMDGVKEKLSHMFEHEMWADFAHKCIGCGTCTFVCPTCYCFDIDLENNGAEGFKFRCWDSCMFSEYTRMAGGHNPRPSKKERVRNRFLHKLEFYEERYGKGSLCVGCGRCVSQCPVALDITQVIDKVGEVSLND